MSCSFAIGELGGLWLLPPPESVINIYGDLLEFVANDEFFPAHWRTPKLDTFAGAINSTSYDARLQRETKPYNRWSPASTLGCAVSRPVPSRSENNK